MSHLQCPNFELFERDIWPGCREIEVEGELDLAVSDGLRAALDRATAQRQHVLVDLGPCDFIDASGLAILVRANRMLRDRNRQLLVYGVRGQVRRLLAITGLAKDGLPISPAPAPPPSKLFGKREAAAPADFEAVA
jgi:anti-anti-sigma factor